MPLLPHQALLGDRPLRAKDHFKLLVGAWLHPLQTRRWITFLQARPALAALAELHPVLLTKIYRPYLATGLGCRGRVDALIGHYEWLERLGLTTLACRAARAPVLLHQGLSRADAPFRIELSAVHEGHREGEFCLHLWFSEQQLFNLNFLLQGPEGQLRLVVGRLQGSADEQARELVRSATRELHGARPASLLLTAARQIAQLLGCREVLLIGNRRRIALNLWRRWHITANYEQTWAELGAVARDDGFWQIEPQGEQQVDYESIASKKRSEARKKAGLLDGMLDGLRQALARERGV